MTEYSAVSRVFSIPELLHEVLSYLPQDCLLLTVQLVCRNWSIALTSPELEKAQWFRPATHNAAPSPSSLLRKKFSIFFDVSLVEPTWFDTLPWKRNPDVFNRAEASWRNMLVFQPPCYSLTIERVKHDRGGLLYQTVILPCPGGLRMGVLWDIAQEWCLRRKHWIEIIGPGRQYTSARDTDYATPLMRLHWHIICPRRGSQASLEDDWVSKGREELDLFKE